MAFVAEVKAKMDLDVTAFQRALTKTAADAGKVGDDINRKLSRSFGGGDVFRGLMMGLGIGSLDKVVDLITSGFSAAAKHAERMAEFTARSLENTKRLIALKQSPEEQLAVLDKEKQVIEAKIAQIKDPKWREFDVWETPWKKKTLVADIPAEKLEEVAKLTNDIEELDLRRGQLQKEIAKDKLNDDKKAVDQYLDEIKKADAEEIRSIENKLANEKQLNELTLANAAKLKDTADEIIDLDEQRANLEATIALSGDEDLSRAVELERINGRLLDLNIKLSDEMQRQADDAKRQADETKRKADEEKRNANAAFEAARSLRDAMQSVEQARSKKAEQFSDRFGISLADAAQSKQGSVKARAREILRLEAQAVRQRVSGFESSAAASQSRADELRKRSGFLTSPERDPMKNASEAIVKSEEHLKRIKEDLERKNVQ